MMLIKNAKIYTMENNIIENGDILINKGKIIKIGSNLNCNKNTTVVDATGKIILPGFVDAHTHIGIGEEDVGWPGRDFDETTSPITPHLRAIDAINPADTGFRDAYQGGVTTVMVTPGSDNVIGGECAVLKTCGNTINNMLLDKSVGLKAAMGENPKRAYGSQNKTPKTRMAIAGLLRQTLTETQMYAKEKLNKENEKFKKDLKYESLLKVLKKEIPLKVHAHRADDIQTIIRIANEFNINITLEHCTEGFKVVDEILNSGFPVLFGPVFGERSKVELKNRKLETAGILSKAGIKVAIISDHAITPTQYLPFYAALCIKAGMDEIEALKAITINPAEILGIDDKVGSIKEGKDADIIIFSGDPLDVRSRIEKVFINGKLVKGNN